MPNKRKRKTREAYKNRYKVYKAENREAKNKETKLIKHLLKHPNDIQSEKKTVVQSYKRKKPLTYWEKMSQHKKENRNVKTA